MLKGIVQGETLVADAGHELWIHVATEEGIVPGIDEGERDGATLSEVRIFGVVLGLLVGELLGNGEGVLDGTTLGDEYEFEYGIVEDMLDGTLDGRLDGKQVGTSEGKLEGSVEGTALGDKDGTVLEAEGKGSDTHQIVFTILTGTCQRTK